MVRPNMRYGLNVVGFPFHHLRMSEEVSLSSSSLSHKNSFSHVRVGEELCASRYQTFLPSLSTYSCNTHHSPHTLEVSMAFLSSPPPFSARSPLKNSVYPLALMLHDPGIPSTTSLFCKVQRDDLHRHVLNCSKDERPSQADVGGSIHQGENSDDAEELVHDLDKQMVHTPVLCNTLECTASPGLENEEVQIVRSTRRLQRHSKRRRVLKEKLTLDKTPISWKPDPKYKALRRLTPEMESELMHHIKEMLKLEKVKDMFQSRFDREPTMVEWAEAVRFSPYTLKLKLDYGRMCREKFYKANLRLAYHMAEQFQGCGVPLVDLKQFGCIGLLNAIDDYDDKFGIRFGAFAPWRIRITISNYINQSMLNHLPRHICNLRSRIRKAKLRFYLEGKHDFSQEDLAREVGTTVNMIEVVRRASITTKSYERTLLRNGEITCEETSDDDDDDDDDEEELADEKYMSPEEYLVSQMTKRQIGEMLNVLGPRERRIIELRFGLEDGVGKSLQDIGDIYGLTRERVRQIESQALKELRECPASKGHSSIMFTKLPEKTETTFDIEEDDDTVA